MKQSKELLKKWGPALLCAVYAYCSLGYLLNLISTPAGFTGSTFSALAAPVFIAALYLPWKDFQGMTDKKCRKRRIIYVFVTGFLLGLSFVLGYQIRTLGMTSVGIKGKLFILLVSGGLAIAFSPMVNFWFQLLDSRRGAFCCKSAFQSIFHRENEESSFAPKKCFFFSWIFIFLCWIPAFLAYYPAIMSYDFHRQCLEASGGFIWFNSYQPLSHTFLIWLFLQLGKAIHSYELGMAAFSLLQMLIFSAVLAYSCNLIGRLCGKKWPVVLTCLLFGLLPVFPVLALCMTKDILFSAFFLLTLLLMLERRLAFLDWTTHKVSKHRLILLDVGFVLSGILTILFRNNTIYAIAVFAIFYVIWSSRERIKILLLCVAILLGGQGIKEGIRVAMNAGKGSNVEMYSVVIQTMARAAKNQEANLTDEQWEMCRYVVGDWDNYNPAWADPVKATVAMFNYPEWENDLPRMFRSWAKIGIAYPNDYLDAVLALTSGYWFLDDVSHAEVAGFGDDTNMGLVYTFNASHNEKFEGVENYSFLPGLLRVYQYIINGNGYYKWPGLSILFKPALYCWVLVLVMISFLYQKKYRGLVLCMLPFWYLMTMFLGPVVNIRYVLPMMVSAPFLLCWLFTARDWDEE